MEASQSTAAPAEPSVPLIDELHNLGATLPPSDLPIHSQVPQVLAAVVKVLDHAGVVVAQELYPPEPVAVPRPETADQAHRQATNNRLAVLEQGLAEILAHLKGDGGS